MSRIHVQISFDPLDNAARGEIWKNNFRRVQWENSMRGREFRVDRDAEDFVLRSKAVQELRWNGRDIRNGRWNLVTLVRKLNFMLKSLLHGGNACL